MLQLLVYSSFQWNHLYQYFQPRKPFMAHYLALRLVWSLNIPQTNKMKFVKI
jgi:hypothetical protein